MGGGGLQILANGGGAPPPSPPIMGTPGWVGQVGRNFGVAGKVVKNLRGAGKIGKNCVWAGKLAANRKVKKTWAEKSAEVYSSHKMLEGHINWCDRKYWWGSRGRGYGVESRGQRAGGKRQGK